MSNIFMYSKTPYFQVHQSLFIGDLLKELKPNATKLYLYLMFEAQKHSTTTLRRTTAQVLNGAGIAESKFADARTQLDKVGLIQPEQTKEGWLFEIPVGVTWDGLDFDSFTADEVKAYFISRTRDDSWLEDGYNGIWVRCPFHYSSKSRERSLSVKLIESGNVKGIGAWRCANQQCVREDRHGRLVDFEHQWMKAHGNKLASRKDAHRRVAEFFASLRAGTLKVDPELYSKDASTAQVMLDEFEVDPEYSTP